jgi:hypothetical protein
MIEKFLPKNAQKICRPNDENKKPAAKKLATDF